MKRSWYGFRGTCYRYHTEEPGDEWHEELPTKIAIQVWILRKLGIKEGMCKWPPKWFEKPIRVLFNPWKSIKNKWYWWFKAPM